MIRWSVRYHLTPDQWPAEAERLKGIFGDEMTHEQALREAAGEYYRSFERRPQADDFIKRRIKSGTVSEIQLRQIEPFTIKLHWFKPKSANSSPAMSTRSAIITTTPTGYAGIYSHSDGYPAWMGNILFHRVTTHKQAAAIVALGSIRGIDCLGEVEAYVRDCGETPSEDNAPSTGQTAADVADQIGHDGHIYVFENGAWSHNGKPLIEALSTPEVRSEISRYLPDYPDLPPPLPPLSERSDTTPMPMPTTNERIALGLAALKNLTGFIGRNQAACVRDLIRTSEDRDFFIDKMIELDERIKAMPVTYQQDGLGDNAIAYLHYFTAGSDFYITEKDKGAKDDDPADFQSQAYGYTILNGDDEMAECGYISLPEILGCNAELDFHFTPTTLAAIKAKRDGSSPPPSERSDTQQPAATGSNRQQPTPPVKQLDSPPPSSPMTHQPMTHDSEGFAFRSYQREDLARSAIHDGAIIAWDPGLGKTMAIFAWPFLKQAKRTLIVAPASLHDQIMCEGSSKFGITVTPIPNQDTALSLMRSGKLPLPGSEKETPASSSASSPMTHDQSTHDSSALPTFFLTDYRWLGYNGGDEWSEANAEITDVIRQRRLAVIARHFGMLDAAFAAAQKNLAAADRTCPAHILLGVDRDAPRSVVKSAYRNLARLTHPDLHPEDATATTRMQRLNAAIEAMLKGDVTQIIAGIDAEAAEAAPTIAALMAGIGTFREYPLSVVRGPLSVSEEQAPRATTSTPTDNGQPTTPRTVRCVFTPTLGTLLADCFDCVVCDEAVRLKSGDKEAKGGSYIAGGVLGLRSKYRLALTGTPIKNRLPDVFHLAGWVCGHNPEPTARWPYGNTAQYKASFSSNHLVMEENLTKQEAARKRGKFQAYRKQTNKVTNVHHLWKLLGPVVARRRKDQIGNDIVGKVIHPIRVMPGTEQQAVYKWHLDNPPDCKTPIAALGAQLQALRQAALCPWSSSLSRRNSKVRWSPKMLAILHLAADLMAKGEQLVIYSPFQEFSTAIKAALQDASVPSLLLDGRVKNTTRGPLAAQFKAGKYPVLIAGIDAMGEGHSFECASHLVIPSLSWAYDANRQAIERVHRLTSRKDVTIYAMITSNSIDERLASIFQEKGDASDLALDGRLFDEDKEEVSLADLIRSATLDFDPTATTLPETSLVQEWDFSLRSRLTTAAATYADLRLTNTQAKPATAATAATAAPTPTPVAQPDFFTMPYQTPTPPPPPSSDHPPTPSNIIPFPTRPAVKKPRPDLTPEQIKRLASAFD